MKKKEKIKRYLYFLIGLFINSFGVAFITKANLGTSPISSIPYVLSLKYSLTLGNYTILFSLVLIGLQILLLRKRFSVVQLLQIPVSILFGYFIDFSMDVLLAWINPQTYPEKMIFLLIGCAILGFGVSMEFTANVIMLPGEGTVNSLHMVLNRETGVLKICVDVSMSVIALIASLVFSGQINGVREGTIIAAVLVGYMAKQYGHFMNGPIERWFKAEKKRLVPVSKPVEQ
ncbi:YitT family protein [uncultured Eubacterium sp.]|uniref:YczE/YyaS/YitT family protein n=1 Tax=uncultured Eubacterium sp. TaxID=165185 RepID=UPI0025998E23|nr:DUF6198 family protein [uncultured Eubacterium sp.]